MNIQEDLNLLSNDVKPRGGIEFNNIRKYLSQFKFSRVILGDNQVMAEDYTEDMMNMDYGGYISNADISLNAFGNIIPQHFVEKDSL